MSDANQVRINELARELEVKAKAIIDLLAGFGVQEKKTHSSSIPADVAEKVKHHLKGVADAESAAESERTAKEAAAKAAARRPAAPPPPAITRGIARVAARSQNPARVSRARRDKPGVPKIRQARLVRNNLFVPCPPETAPQYPELRRVIGTVDQGARVLASRCAPNNRA